jgi:hypothetical protein
LDLKQVAMVSAQVATQPPSPVELQEFCTGLGHMFSKTKMARPLSHIQFQQDLITLALALSMHFYTTLDAHSIAR